MADRAGISQVMRFVGRLPHDRFATALNASDVFISVPSVDATAVSLLEAMACGCAVVVSALPSAEEWVDDGVSGLVVAPRDEEALTKAMLKYAEDVELRTSFAKAANSTAQRYAGFAMNMEYAHQIFTRLVEGQGEWPAEVGLPVLQRRTKG